jgi:hypothetical protein
MGRVKKVKKARRGATRPPSSASRRGRGSGRRKSDVKRKTKKAVAVAKQKRRGGGVIQKGKGVMNWLISRLPFEAHVPGYNYCGPGTRLKERVAKGDKPRNDLDAACREHDIAYYNAKDVGSRNIADRILRDKAAAIGKASKWVGEKLISKMVSKVMDVKQANNW